jgi:hypothetical protein
MTKRKIKVVKRDTPAPVIEPVPKPPTDPDRKMTNTVKDWISERRENREAESLSNRRQSVKWHSTPNPVRKPA